MSIYNSEAYLKNTSASPITIGTVSIASNSFVSIWDSKTSNRNSPVWDRFAQIRDNHSTMYPYIRDGYMNIIQDGLNLNSEQSLDVLSQMYYQDAQVDGIDKILSIKQSMMNEDDGRQIVTPSPVGVGWWICFTGADDDKTQYETYKLNPFAPSGRNAGKPFLVESDGYSSTSTVEEFSFCEPVHIHDGEINWGPDGSWTISDSYNVGMKFSPTAVQATPGTGNCNLISVLTQQPTTTVDGYEMIIPAVDGQFTVDLTTACPIRDPSKLGFWNVDETIGTISTGESGSSGYNLYTFAPSNVWFMRNINTSNSRRTMEPDSYRTEVLHPTWKIVLSVTKRSAGYGWLTGWFTCFRRSIQG